LREIDMVRVKGREQPVRIHELLEEAGAPAAADRQALLEAFCFSRSMSGW
jgi:hypothetical protein